MSTLKRTRTSLLLGIILGFVSVPPLLVGQPVESAGNYDTDPETGLIKAPGFETVKNNCTVCHSARTFAGRGYTRKVWLEQIRWMQESQGLWEFDKKTEKTILDYLETYYPPG